MLNWMILLLVMLIELYSFSLTGSSLVIENKFLEYCHLAASKEKRFKNFRRSSVFLKHIDKTSPESGLACLNYILEEYPDLLSHFEKFRENDIIGNPLTFDYGSLGSFSPTTLKNIKIAGDLREQFGNTSQMHIVEIGGGYGGLCQILAQLDGFASYTIVDSPPCLALARRYLAALEISNVYFKDIKNFTGVRRSDLIISDLGFFEADPTDQLKWLSYIKKIPHGYLSGFPSANTGSNAVQPENLISLFYNEARQGVVKHEELAIDAKKQIVIWKPSKVLCGPITERPKFNISSLQNQAQNAITYSFSGGRLGDNLVAYLHARWMSYKYGLPLLYMPFPYSDQFCLHDMDVQFSDSFIFSKTHWTQAESQISTKPSATLYIIPFVMESKFEYNWFNLKNQIPFIKADWEDPSFRAEVIRCLQPKYPVATVVPPKDVISIAVHVRRTEAPVVAAMFPLKFLPDSFYIEQIQRVAEIFKDKNLYVHIFTDLPDPLTLVNFYKAAVNNPRIEFGCRAVGNTFYTNVLEDFYSFANFDCLICSLSHYPMVASLLKDFAVIISPAYGTVTNDQLEIHQLEIKFKGQPK